MSYVKNMTKQPEAISGGAEDWTRMPHRFSARTALSMSHAHMGLRKASNYGQ